MPSLFVVYNRVRALLALCQLQWVDEKLSSRKDKFRPFFFDIQSDENPFFEVFKVPKTKGIALDKFDEIIGCFQFGIRIVQLKGVDNLFFIFEEGFKDSLKNRMNLLKIVFNKPEKFLWFLILEVKKQELIELIVMFQVL